MQLSNVDERPSLILTRIFPVAPEKVWRAWTDPDALRIWWNQADSPGWIGELDVRAGGRYRVVIKDPEGVYHDVRGVYREVVPNRKLGVTSNLPDGPPERETVVFSYIVYKSRADRDRVVAKVMKDKRLAAMMDPRAMPFDGKRMIYGGFKVLVDL